MEFPQTTGRMWSCVSFASFSSGFTCSTRKPIKTEFTTWNKAFCPWHAAKWKLSGCPLCRKWAPPGHHMYVLNASIEWDIPGPDGTFSDTCLNSYPCAQTKEKQCLWKKQGREEENGIMREWEMTWGKVEKACTHLAASKSSSFLYSPKWLQKIMVSEANRMKDVQQQQEARVTKEQRTAGSPTQTTQTHTHTGISAPMLPCFSLVLCLSLSSGGGVAERQPLLPDETVTLSRLWTRHRQCLGYGGRTDAYPCLLHKLNGSLSQADRQHTHTHAYIQTHTPLPLYTVSLILPLNCQFYVCIGGAVAVITQDKRGGEICNKQMSPAPLSPPPTHNTQPPNQSERTN